MQTPDGFIKEGEEHWFVNLKKSLYSLKQAAWSRNIKINELLIKEDFARSNADVCFYKKRINDCWMYILGGKIMFVFKQLF